MPDLYPKLCILFDAPWMAFHFFEQCGAISSLSAEIKNGTIVEITGADHPMLRQDLLLAASHIGGEEIPEKRNG